MTKLATIEKIVDIYPHPDPEVERLEIVKVLNFNCIVPKGTYQVGEHVILIQPDSVLPDEEWAAPYKKFNPKRVKAAKIRGVWSFGIVEKLSLCHSYWKEQFYWDNRVGTDVTDILNITKYETPIPEEPGAIGALPHFLIPTDETLHNNLNLEDYIGSKIDVTTKIDGSSATYYYIDGKFGVCGRRLEFDIDKLNKYTHQVSKYNLHNKLAEYCEKYKVNLALRGEVYGQGIQSSKNNPHSKLPLNIAFYNVWIIDEMRYAYKGEKHYFVNVCNELDLPYVRILEEDIELTTDLLKKYDEKLDKIDGQPFEGVVIKGNNFSFKVINKAYDNKK